MTDYGLLVGIHFPPVLGQPVVYNHVPGVNKFFQGLCARQAVAGGPSEDVYLVLGIIDIQFKYESGTGELEPGAFRDRFVNAMRKYFNLND